MSRRTLEERFWEKVERFGEDGCWFWLGSLNALGYGQFFSGKYSSSGYAIPARSHRLAYELLIGPIPEGQLLDHLCRNPSCVNPAHLEPVSPAVNVRRGNSTKNLSLRRDSLGYSP